MKHVFSLPYALRLATASALAIAANLASAQTTSTDAAPGTDARCPPDMTALQRHLYALATDSPDALRRFVHMRRGTIAELDMPEVVAWIDQQVDLSRVACATASATSDTARVASAASR